MLAGGVPLLAVATVIVCVLRVAWIVVRGDQTAGLTTSLALISAVLLGALAIETATMAAGVAVLIASLLAAREVLHNFSRTVLTPVELRDGLILGVSVLVILPALPNLDVGPGGALNPRNLFSIIVLIMSIGAAGHIATRVVGARLGLPLSGFLSGFVSSTATITALGRRAGPARGRVGSGTLWRGDFHTVDARRQQARDAEIAVSGVFGQRCYQVHADRGVGDARLGDSQRTVWQWCGTSHRGPCRSG
jgi:uncharacterized membrane protein (DUF4010 family)